MSQRFDDIFDVRSIDELEKILNSNDIIINLTSEHRDAESPKILHDDAYVQGARNTCE